MPALGRLARTARLWALVAGIALAGQPFVCKPAASAEVEFSGRAVQREILALYDGQHEAAPHLTRIHRFAEMPLNHMGFTLTYRDVNKALPGIAELGRYRGIITWFLEPLKDAETVVHWLDRATERPLRYVAIGDIAPPGEMRLQPIVTRIFSRLGLTFTGEVKDLPLRGRVAFKDDAMVGFEQPVDKVLTSFPVLAARPNQATAHLAVESQDRHGQQSSVVVATSPKGGFAVHDYTVFYEPTNERSLWIVNPFRFLRLAFGEERFPIPDVTTLAGRRIYFSHIDGDGWNNLTEIESYRASQSSAADVIAREAIEAYPDLPVSVGLIAGDARPELGGSLRGRLPRAACSPCPTSRSRATPTRHPFTWKFFERYDRAAELRLIDKIERPERPLRDRLHTALVQLSGRIAAPGTTRADERYVAGSNDLPRTYLKEPFDLELEVAGALRFTELIAPAGKRAKLYLWSGDTTPFEAAIRATRLAGVRNINGGDSRLDQEYPSVTYVVPVGRVIGSERQIYSANSNENTYTNDWTGPYYGFFLLEQTLRNTEAPRRLKPFSLYYHMYSGEKPAALASIKHFLALARQSPLIPIAASDYAAIADAFYSVEIERIGAASWAVSRRGSLSTVRFDDADEIEVNLAESSGVLGSNRHQRALYVALDPAVERAIVTLNPKATVAPAVGPARAATSLVESRWQVLERTGDRECGFAVTVQGYGPGEMVWQARAGRGFRVVLERDGSVVSEEIRWADPSGLLTLRLEASAIQPLKLTMACHE